MAYEKQTWATGDTITAEKLNHMEDGISNSVLSVDISTSGDTKTMNKTWQEIHDAAKNGLPIVITELINEDYVEHYIFVGSEYDDNYFTYIAFVGGQNSISFFSYMADSLDGYPSAGGIE